MRHRAKATRHDRTITVDFCDESTYFQVLSDGKAFVEFVLAFILALGFQLTHKPTCRGGGCLTQTWPTPPLHQCGNKVTVCRTKVLPSVSCQGVVNMPLQALVSPAFIS
jgi:hypothetical protein